VTTELNIPQDLKFLIADPSTGRKSIRKLLSDIGVKTSQVDVAEGFGDAKEILEKHKCNIVFADSSLGNKQGLELLILHKQVVPADRIRAAVYFTAKDSNSMAATVADDDVDGIIIKPFTFGILQEKIIAVLTKKIHPSPADKLLEEGKLYFSQNKLDDAITAFRQTIQLDPSAAIAYSMLGASLAKNQEPDEAILAFDQGLKCNPTHFRSLCGKLDLLLSLNRVAEAYEVGKTIALNHTIPLGRIPDLIRLSILNSKFDDVCDFYKYAETLAASADLARRPIAAGLVVAGLHFLRTKNVAQAIDAFRKAENASMGSPQIVSRIIIALADAKLESEFNALLGRASPEVRQSPAVLTAEVNFIDKTQGPQKGLDAAYGLIRQGVVVEKIFEIAIRRSIELKRKPESIQELLDLAMSKIPERKEFFENLGKGSSSPG